MKKLNLDPHEIFGGIIVVLLIAYVASMSIRRGDEPSLPSSGLAVASQQVNPAEEVTTIQTWTSPWDEKLIEASPEATMSFTVTPLGLEKQVSFELGDATPLLVKNKRGVRFALGGATTIAERGAPQVPEWVNGLELGAGERLIFEAASLQWQTNQIREKVLTNRLGSEASGERSLKSASGFTPDHALSIDHAWVGQRKFARVGFRPVQVDPERKRYRYVTGGTLRLKISSEEVEPVPPVASQSVSFDDCDCSYRMVNEALPVTAGVAAEFSRRRAGHEVNACIRIGIEDTGIHRLTRGELVAAGVDPALLVGADLRLFYRDQEIAVKVSRTDLFTDNDDHVLFFAEALKTYHAEENAVWLGFGAGGLRWNTESSSPLVGTNFPLITSACMRQVRDSHVYYDPNLVDVLRSAGVGLSSFDGWGLGVVSRFGSISYPYSDFSGQTDHIVLDSPQTIRANVWSTTPNQHVFAIRRLLGSSPIAEWNWSGVAFQQLSATVTNAFTTPGLSIVFEDRVNSSGTFHASVLQSWELDVERELHLINGALGFGADPGAANIRLDGISDTSGFTLINVTDPYHPVETTGFTVVENGSEDQILFGQIALDSRCYFAAETGGLLDVSTSNISIWEPRTLSDTGRTADYLLIAPNVFEDALERLLQRRDQTGLEVCFASLEDIYNEFGYGVSGPEAIKQFIGYAFHHWQQPPSMALLVGDGRYNPLENEPLYPDHVPVPMGASTDIWTSFDPWYGQVNGSDLVADVAVGRLPVETLAELNRLLDRFGAFETNLVNASPLDPSSWRRKMTVTADNEFPQPFDILSNELINDVLNETNVTVTQNYLASGGGNAAAVRQGVVDAFENGSFALSYMGHGANDSWSDQTIFNTATAQSISNTNYPIVTVFTCLNGAFQVHKRANGNSFEATESLPETLLRYDDDGAVAMLAPSSLAQAQSSHLGGMGFYEALLLDQYIVGINQSQPVFESRPTRYLGEAYLNIAASMFLRVGSGAPELNTYTLFGDPGLVVVPENEGTITP